MLYEIAYVEKDAIVRGGIKAAIRTVGSWIERNKETDPQTVYFAIPADDNAITIAEYRAECKQ